MAQQTAVEFLVNELRLNLTIYKHTKNVIEQAKAMEKEQIKNAYWNGTTDMEKPDAMNDADKFYNEYYSE